MSSFVESSPLSRDQISLATPSQNTFRSQFYNHQRSYSNQLTYTSLPQPVLASKFSQQPSVLSSFGSLPKKDDQELQTFQIPNSSSAKQNIKVIDKPLEEFLRDISQKKRNQTRTSRIYTVEDMKAEPILYINPGLNKEQSQSQSTTINSNNVTSTKEPKAEVSTASSASPSPLLLQFANMDLRKRASIMPIKPVEMNFDKQLQTKLGSKFRNLKIEDNLDGENKGNNDSNLDDSNDSSPVEIKKSKKHLISDFGDHNNSEDDDDIVSIDGDENDSDEDTDEGSVSDNIIVEVRSIRNYSLKGILKKPSMSLRNLTFPEENKQINANGESGQQNNGNTKQSQLIHHRSNSLTVLPSFNINSLLEQYSSSSSSIQQQNQSKQQQSPFISNTPTNSSNILGNRDLNQQISTLTNANINSKDYQFTSVVTPFLEKQSSGVSTPVGRSQWQRSQSLTGIIKRVQFMLQNEPNQQNMIPEYSNMYSLQSPTLQSQSSNSSIYSSGLANYSGTQNNALPITSNQRTLHKSNSFNKFYSAFKQNLSNSKSEIFSSPQVKSSLNGNHNHNNSISSTVSTVPSMSSFSQYSSLQAANPQLPVSNSSSASSTPLASQSSISNLISPLSAQQSNERKNPISQTLLHSVFKDMKLTKNTKVYLDQKLNSPCFSSSPSVKANTISAFSLNSPSAAKQSEFLPKRRNPSTEIIFRTSNA